MKDVVEAMATVIGKQTAFVTSTTPTNVCLVRFGTCRSADSHYSANPVIEVQRNQRPQCLNLLP